LGGERPTEKWTNGGKRNKKRPWVSEGAEISRNARLTATQKKKKEFEKKKKKKKTKNNVRRGISGCRGGRGKTNDPSCQRRDFRESIVVTLKQSRKVSRGRGGEKDNWRDRPSKNRAHKGTSPIGNLPSLGEIAAGKRATQKANINAVWL